MMVNSRILGFLAATYVFVWRTFSSYFPIGQNVFDYEWDLVIVLDACRIDALREVEDEYEFISDIESVTSVGSTSVEWIHNTFIQEHISDIQSTSYVTANGFSNHVRTEGINRLRTSETKGTIYENSSLAKMVVKNDSVGGQLGSYKLVEGVEMSGESGPRTYYPPDLVTARAIETSRRKDPDKMIVHYMQPHAPYIADAMKREEYEPHEDHPFQYLKEGGDKSIVWDAYLDNLRLVLENVKILLENTDAESVVITADHGELFGECGLYAHTYGIPHPALKKVPWVETKAKDKRTISSEDLLSSYDQISYNGDIEDRLSALGYIT